MKKRAVVWGLFGLFFADLTFAEGKRVSIDGEAIYYYLKSFLDSTPGEGTGVWKAAALDAVHQLKRIDLESGRELLTVRGSMHRSVDLTWISPKQAKRAEIYRARVPQEWSVQIRLQEGLATVSSLEEFEFFAKIPALPDRLFIREAKVNPLEGHANLWIKAIGGIADLVARVDWSEKGGVTVQWWDSFVLNLTGGPFAPTAP